MANNKVNELRADLDYWLRILEKLILGLRSKLPEEKEKDDVYKFLNAIANAWENSNKVYRREIDDLKLVVDNLEHELAQAQQHIGNLSNDIDELLVKLEKLNKKNGWNWFNIQQLKDKK